MINLWFINMVPLQKYLLVPGHGKSVLFLGDHQETVSSCEVTRGLTRLLSHSLQGPDKMPPYLPLKWQCKDGLLATQDTPEVSFLLALCWPHCGLH